METWEMVKAITDNPNKKFRSLIDGAIVVVELGSAIKGLDSRYGGDTLHIDDEWEEV